MQTIDFLQTAKWIRGLYSEEAQELFSLGDMHPQMIPMLAIGEARLPITARLTHHLAIVRENLITNPKAVQVLNEFGLEVLTSEDFPIRLAELKAAMDNPKTRPRHPGEDTDVQDDREPRDYKNTLREAVELFTPLWEGWRLLVGCIKPIENLVVPKMILAQQSFDEVLTLELRYEDEMSPTLGTLSSVLVDIQELYAAISTLYGLKEYPQLTVIYADSGTSIRLDLRGLGEPIKRIKELFIESWAFIRHRKAEDFRQNNSALLEGLESVQKIKSMRDEGSLNPEDALRLTRLIIESTSHLFDAGVLIREIPRSEIVSNQALIETYYRRLLPPKPDEESTNANPQVAHVPKRKPRRKTSEKSSAKNRANSEDH